MLTPMSILGTGRNGRSALDLAREAAQQFGSLRELLGADRAPSCCVAVSACEFGVIRAELGWGLGAALAR